MKVLNNKLRRTYKHLFLIPQFNNLITFSNIPSVISISIFLSVFYYKISPITFKCFTITKVVITNNSITIRKGNTK